MANRTDALDKATRQYLAVVKAELAAVKTELTNLELAAANALLLEKVEQHLEHLLQPPKHPAPAKPDRRSAARRSEKRAKLGATEPGQKEEGAAGDRKEDLGTADQQTAAAAALLQDPPELSGGATRTTMPEMVPMAYRAPAIDPTVMGLERRSQGAATAIKTEEPIRPLTEAQLRAGR